MNIDPHRFERHSETRVYLAMSMKTEMLRKVKETAKYHHLQSRDYDDPRSVTKKINTRKAAFHDLYVKKHENVT